MKGSEGVSKCDSGLSGHRFSVTGGSIGEAASSVFKVGVEGKKLEFYGRWESLLLL